MSWMFSAGMLTPKPTCSPCPSPLNSFKNKLGKANKGDLPYEVTKPMKPMSASVASATHKALKSAGEVCISAFVVAKCFPSQAMIQKIDALIVKTIKGPAVKAANIIAALCPSNLQTPKMVPSAVAKESIPLIDTTEWDRYLTLPAQQPAPSSTAGRVQWWLTRMAEFPKLAPKGGGRFSLHIQENAIFPFVNGMVILSCLPLDQLLSLFCLPHAQLHKQSGPFQSLVTSKRLTV